MYLVTSSSFLSLPHLRQYIMRTSIVFPRHQSTSITQAGMTQLFLRHAPLQAAQAGDVGLGQACDHFLETPLLPHYELTQVCVCGWVCFFPYVLFIFLLLSPTTLYTDYSRVSDYIYCTVKMESEFLPNFLRFSVTLY